MSKQREIAIVGHALYNNYPFNKETELQGVIHLKAHTFEEDARTTRGTENKWN